MKISPDTFFLSLSNFFYRLKIKMAARPNTLKFNFIVGTCVMAHFEAYGMYTKLYK